jgi:hypothetical protein
MFKVNLENKTKKLIYGSLKNFSIDEKEKLVDVKEGESKVLFADSTIANLYIYNEKKKLLWTGTIPTNVMLEIFEEDCKLDVYLDNNKLPAFTIEDLECKINPSNCKKSNYLIIFGIVTIFIILIFVLKKYYTN